MTRSTDTLTKSIITAQDYKKMMSKGSIDSMDKSVISSNTSLGGYESHHIQQKSPVHNKSKYSPTNSDSSNGKKGSTYDQKVTNTPQYDSYGQGGFDLSYRNEGFRDNSSINTRNNSYGTNLNEETPIVHHNDIDDTVSDYYGRTSTLPMTPIRNENLAFLSELKSQLPEYEQLNSGHSSFIASASNPAYDQSPSSFHSFGPEKRNPGKASKISSASKQDVKHEVKKSADYAQPTTIRMVEHDNRRPDSYFTAMQNARDSRNINQISASSTKRPKAVYQSSTVYDRPVLNLRSKSEALLEANFDDQPNVPDSQLKSDSRSYSQPMETAM